MHESQGFHELGGLEGSREKQLSFARTLVLRIADLQSCKDDRTDDGESRNEAQKGRKFHRSFYSNRIAKRDLAQILQANRSRDCTTEKANETSPPGIGRGPPEMPEA